MTLCVAYFVILWVSRIIGSKYKFELNLSYFLMIFEEAVTSSQNMFVTDERPTAMEVVFVRTFIIFHNGNTPGMLEMKWG